MKINRIAIDKNEYLRILCSIDSLPETLYFIGQLPKDRLKTVAIVGSRKPTTYGREVTYRLAYDLAKKGTVIVSGLALGIDAIAHQAALDAGGKTIAVLANGLDYIYPSLNKRLAENILNSGGAILSEYPPGIRARDYQFLERNRIVSGLSDMVIVTEAASRSGTLSTVGHALNQGKEVGAIPGNITSPMSSGCNKVLKQGAHVILGYEDVLNIIDPGYQSEQASLVLGANESEAKIIDLLQKGVRDGDELARMSGLSIIDFSTSLTMLEINGVVRALGGNQWTLS